MATKIAYGATQFEPGTFCRFFNYITRKNPAIMTTLAERAQRYYREHARRLPD